MPKFITLAGRKQVGKSTSANIVKTILMENYGYSDSQIHIVAFAEALKEAVSIIFGISRLDMESETGKQKLTDVEWPIELKAIIPPTLPTLASYDVKAWISAAEYRRLRPQVILPSSFMTVRQVLQFVGTDMFRSIIDPDTWVKSVYRKQYRPTDVIIVGDCRFPNEAEFAKDKGLLIKIDRDTGVLKHDMHVSETALDSYTDFHGTIDNNGSFTDLYHSWRKVLNTVNFPQV